MVECYMQMENNMTVSGRTIEKMEKEDIIITMGYMITMMENGKMIKRKVKEH